MVLTNQDRGFMTVHGGTMDNEPLVYQALFDSKKGFIEILSETASVINTISKEYGDPQTKSFLETLESFKKQLQPEEVTPEVAVDKAGTDQVESLMNEMAKNITDTTTYYETQLNELLDLFSQRSEELIQSLDTYDKELRGWIDSNMAVIKQFGFEKRAKQEMDNWDTNIEKLKTKIDHFRK